MKRIARKQLKNPSNMREATNLKDLLEKLRSQQLLKRDMVVPKSCLQMMDGRMQIINASGNDQLQELLIGTGISADNGLGERHINLEVTPLAHRQIATKLNIPWIYYEKVSEEKYIECLDFNVNYWMQHQPEDTLYLIRTFINAADDSGIMRAMLSDRFKMIDHYDVLLAAMDAIRQSGVEVEFKDCALTDTRIYIQAEAPTIIKQSPELLKQYRTPGSNGNGDS